MGNLDLVVAFRILGEREASCFEGPSKDSVGLVYPANEEIRDSTLTRHGFTYLPPKRVGYFRLPEVWG